MSKRILFTVDDATHKAFRHLAVDRGLSNGKLLAELVANYDCRPPVVPVEVLVEAGLVPKELAEQFRSLEAQIEALARRTPDPTKDVRVTPEMLDAPPKVDDTLASRVFNTPVEALACLASAAEGAKEGTRSKLDLTTLSDELAERAKNRDPSIDVGKVLFPDEVPEPELDDEDDILKAFGDL